MFRTESPERSEVQGPRSRSRGLGLGPWTLDFRPGLLTARPGVPAPAPPAPAGGAGGGAGSPWAAMKACRDFSRPGPPGRAIRAPGRPPGPSPWRAARRAPGRRERPRGKRAGASASRESGRCERLADDGEGLLDPVRDGVGKRHADADRGDEVLEERRRGARARARRPARPARTRARTIGRKKRAKRTASSKTRPRRRSASSTSSSAQKRWPVP